MAVFEKRITAGADDVEQTGSSVAAGSSDLELVTDGSAVQTVGLRFTGIDIPAGAVITAAYIQFQTDEVSTGAASLLIRGEASDDAAAFSGQANVTSRATTGASTAWAPAGWTTVGAAGAAQRTPDLTAIVQEIVARQGWAALNDMAFVITGSGTRTAEAFEGDAAGAPLLHIEYTTAAAGAAPVLDLDGGAAGAGYATTFHENGAAVAIAGLAVITDADSATLAGATATLGNPGAGDALTVNTAGLPSGISVNAGATTASSVVLTGSASPADYALALQQIRFANSSETPAPASRLVQVTVSDGLAVSNTATATIAIDRAPDAVNDAAATSPGVAVTTGNVLANDDLGDTPTTITGFDATGTQGGSVAMGGNGTFTYTPAPGFTGTDTFTYTVTDQDGDTSTATVAVAVTETPPQSMVFEKRITAGADDVEQTGSSVAAGSSDLELVTDGSAVQTVGLRFTGIDIPAGAVITAAYIQFQTDEVSTGAASLLIRGEASDDAAAFSGQANVTSRATTGASTAWAPAGWTTVGAAGAAQRTPDLTAIVQEIVARQGWAALNDMAFVITGSGTRTAEAFEGDAAGAPLLHIEYTTAAAGAAPVLDLDGGAAGAGYATTFHENGAAVAIAGLAVITDADSATLAGATATLGNPGAGDALTVNTAGLPSGISVNAGATTASSVVLTGSASPADYALALQQIRFANSSETPAPASRLVQVTVSDGLAVSNTATATIAIDRAPDAVNDAAATSPGVAVTTGNVLANDDLGDTPTTITGFDATGTQGGSVAMGGNGTFTYTPAPGFTGIDTFTYTITDQDGDSSVGTVTVAVGVNAQPTDVTLLQGAPFLENKAGAVAGTLDATDPNGFDTHTFTVSDDRFEVLGDILKLKDGIRLDFEREPQIALQVTATDLGGLSVTRNVSVAVADVAEVRFAAFGDWPDGDGTEDVANLVKSMNVDFIITTGDNIYDPNESVDSQIGRHYSDYIGSYSGSFGSGSTVDRFYPSIGNHEYEDGDPNRYFDYFTLPGNERYYDYVIGPVHFFVLNSNPEEPDGRSSTSTQAQWLQDALASSTAAHKIVYFHHPAYNSGTQHGPTTSMRWPFEAWGATAVLAGHEHVYERILRDDNGDGDTLPYFTTGVGGNGIYEFGSPVAGSQVRYNGNYGTMIVQASETGVSFEFWSIDGNLIDSYYVEGLAAPGGGNPTVVAQHNLASIGIPDPSGIAFDPRTAHFFLSDAEIDEEPHFINSDIFKFTHAGALVESYNPMNFTTEPTGLALDPVQDLLFISDDDLRKVFVVDPDAPTTVLWTVDTLAIGCIDPEDVAVNSATGRLFVVSGETDHKIVETNYTGTQVFSTVVMPSQISDPEALAYDPGEDVFYVGGGFSENIWKVDRNGNIVDVIAVLANDSNPISGYDATVKDIELAPASAGSGETHIYVADFGDSHVKDGRLFEIDPGNVIV